jgi:hypothetical protein
MFEFHNIRLLNCSSVRICCRICIQCKLLQLKLIIQYIEHSVMILEQFCMLRFQFSCFMDELFAFCVKLNHFYIQEGVLLLNKEYVVFTRLTPTMENEWSVPECFIDD